MHDEIDGSLEPETAPRRGRPRSTPTMVISVRLPEQVYDQYCSRANRAQVPVRQVLRRVLTQYAPPR